MVSNIFFIKIRLEFDREKNQNWKLLLAIEFSKRLRKKHGERIRLHWIGLRLKFWFKVQVKTSQRLAQGLFLSF